MAWDPLANPGRMPQILTPIEESRDFAADMRGFTLNPEQLKKNGYQLEDYMPYDLMRMRRCKRCRRMSLFPLMRILFRASFTDLCSCSSHPQQSSQVAQGARAGEAQGRTEEI